MSYSQFNEAAITFWISIVLVKVSLKIAVIVIFIIFFRGCRRQPLYCFQIDVFIWLHVTDIYIYIYIYIYIIREPTVERQCLHLY